VASTTPTGSPARRSRSAARVRDRGRGYRGRRRRRPGGPAHMAVPLLSAGRGPRRPPVRGAVPALPGRRGPLSRSRGRVPPLNARTRSTCTCTASRPRTSPGCSNAATGRS